MKAAIEKTSSRVTLLPLAAAAMLWTGAAAASPLGEQSVTRTETVKYLPSALESMDGAAEFYAALKSAAERVCRDPETFATKSMKGDAAAREQCVKDALRQAVRRVDVPIVSYLHQGGTAALTASLK